MSCLAASFLLSAPANHRAGVAPSLLGRLLRWLGAWGDQHHLHDLSDHVLKDVGLLRDQIDDVVRGTERRPGYRSGLRG